MLLHSKSPEQTVVFGEKLGQLLIPGCLVYLSGDLGAGKTNFAQGVIKGLGVEQPVTSPTYTIVNEYQGRYPVYHFDVYRLNHWTDLEDLGYEDYFYGRGVTIIEWADSIAPILPPEGIWIKLSSLFQEGSEEERVIEVWSEGEQTKKMIEEWINNCLF